MSTHGHYSYENNILVKHIDESNPKCICKVEQYLNIQRNFAPPESVKKLEEYLSGMLSNMKLGQKENVFLFENLMSLAKTNLFNGPKRVRVELNGGSFRTINGALHYMNGNIDMDAKVSLSIKKRNEKPYPLFSGKGNVYLEPVRSSQNFLFVPVDGVVRVDKEIFYACDGNLKFETVWMKGAGAALFGGEGLTEHQLTGKGWLLLTLPVPSSEVQKIQVKQGECLTVDGNFVILRKGNIEFGVKAMGKGLGKLFNTSGEGMVNTYKGEGEIWLCPTWKQKSTLFSL